MQPSTSVHLCTCLRLEKLIVFFNKLQNIILFLYSGDDNSVWLINQAYQIHLILFKISLLDMKERLWMLLKSRAYNDAEILLNGKLPYMSTHV